MRGSSSRSFVFISSLVVCMGREHLGPLAIFVTIHPAIKLFGTTIPTLQSSIPSESEGKYDVGFRIPYNSEAMGKIRGEETWISLGPWGGNGGTDWAYKVDGPIMKMTIYGSIFIRSIVFESNSGDGVTIGSSEKIDGTSDCAAETV
ncbi:hypothetical protein RHSIM_Rhsim12G0045400 [Rhododendron simsii]|uniref:Uncharacterized protein n=1 Tax=Rhododendron simsii TaxID=118357 RepID=A0A834G7G3_RHOSS|nr:hypothetical protein RHSIM_Rhsim12G0045400 [Rhododendron simsii]